MTRIKNIKVQDNINKAPIDVFAFETKKLGYDEPFVSDFAMPLVPPEVVKPPYDLHVSSADAIQLTIIPI